MASKCNALCVAESMILKFRQKKCPLRNGRGLLIQLLFLDSQRAAILPIRSRIFRDFFPQPHHSARKDQNSALGGHPGAFFYTLGGKCGTSARFYYRISSIDEQATLIELSLMV